MSDPFAIDGPAASAGDLQGAALRRERVTSGRRGLADLAQPRGRPSSD